MINSDDQCECTSCQLARITDIVAALCERLSSLEAQSIEVLGDVTEDGTVKWRDET